MTPSDLLSAELRRAGYYPELVRDVLDVAIADEAVESSLVHVETTFDGAEVRRHLTVLVLTRTRLVSAHVDDYPADSEHPSASAAATTESVPLSALRSVTLTQVMADPEHHRPGQGAAEITLAVGWGAANRIDLEPAQCPDPQCDADHGYTGQSVPDDVVVRISADAEGADAVRSATDFARRLSAVSGVR
ncbi:DUF5998 family protein [Paraoerskovia marina]|uniref:Phosphodiesterase n=1 Tax=Paraoerskovia marina TaxID=545619 RepID=A0A1H1SBL9_9CELL|nr:DUF5998 family protein [Paraoerskovia marina]SDS45352.1 hypothetical protein SAMN04489860_1584 [Paraoerskovia marina]